MKSIFSSHRSLPTRDAGFTLIEIVLAVALLSMMLVVSYAAVDAISNSKRLLDQERETRAIIDGVLNRLTRELQVALQNEMLLPPQGSTSGMVPSDLVFQGESKERGGIRADALRFMSSAGKQYLPGALAQANIVQITYRLMPPAEGEERGPQQVLVREEVPKIRPIEKAYERALIFPVSEAVVSFAARYYSADDGQWSSSWGASGGQGLPSLVEITLVIEPPGGIRRTVTTAVAVRR